MGDGFSQGYVLGDVLDPYADLLFPVAFEFLDKLAEFTLHKLISYMSYFTVLWQVAVSSGVC